MPSSQGSAMLGRGRDLDHRPGTDETVPERLSTCCPRSLENRDRGQGMKTGRIEERRWPRGEREARSQPGCESFPEKAGCGPVTLHEGQDKVPFKSAPLERSRDGRELCCALSRASSRPPVSELEHLGSSGARKNIQRALALVGTISQAELQPRLTLTRGDVFSSPMGQRVLSRWLALSSSKVRRSQPRRDLVTEETAIWVPMRSK
ncbi:hypothetical protein VTI74DRAFT_1694 [Chaetomium olivicolor]